MTIPLWFMDVDGVLNAFPADPPGKLLEGWQEFKASPNRWRGMTDADIEEAQWRPGGLRRYRIMYDPTIIQRIKDMVERELVQVVWLTTWGAGANGELRQGLGLPKFPSAGEPTYLGFNLNHTDDDGVWWKWTKLREYLAKHPETDKFVWTDDHLSFEREAGEWCLSEGGLFVVTDQTEGLTHDQLDLVEAYLTKSDVQLTTDGVK